MQKQNNTARVFILLFLALSLIPSVGMLLWGGSKAGANEILAPKPKFQRNSVFNTAYFSDLSDYLSDRFFLRQEAITLRNRLSTELFATSPSEKVALGKEDWLFYAETLDALPLTERELWCAGENLRLLQEHAQERGAKFLFVLCPNKSTLCPQKLRSGTPSEDGQRFEKLLQELNVPYCSLYSPLYGREEYFYHGDSHWNEKGAAVAADSILAQLERESAFAQGPFTKGEGHAGDLSEMIYPARPAVESNYLYPFTFSYTSNYRAPNDPLITTAGQGRGTLLCYRDSFGNALHPYLAESFAQASFSRKTSFDLSTLDCDVLLIELVERNIDYLYTYNHLYPAPERKVDISSALPAPERGGECSYAEPYYRISGEIEGLDCAPLYLLQGEKIYECAPKQTGFTLCLPTMGEDLHLVYEQGGQLYMAPLVIKEG